MKNIQALILLLLLASCYACARAMQSAAPNLPSLQEAVVPQVLQSGTSPVDFVEFPVSAPTPGSGSGDMTVGRDGAIWFIEDSNGGDSIGRIDMRGSITLYPLNVPGFSPVGLALGPDGAFWTANPQPPEIARITTSGVVTVFQVPGSSTDLLQYITAGPDGRLWWTDITANNTGYIGATTVDGVSTVYGPIQGSGFGGQVRGIVAGPDGNMWAAAVNQVVRISATGQITLFPLPPKGGVFVFIAVGPDGNLWLTSQNNALARVTRSGPG